MNVLKSLVLTATLILSAGCGALAQGVPENLEEVEATKTTHCKMAAISLEEEWEKPELSVNAYELAKTCMDLEVYIKSLTIPTHLTDAQAKRYMDTVKQLAELSSPIKVWELKDNDKALEAYSRRVDLLIELVFKLSGEK
jgi:hypothetical protein